MGKIAIGQAGGPTAVFNSSLAGFIEDVEEEVYFVFGGYEGLVMNHIKKASPDDLARVQAARGVPGAMLGSGRYPFDENGINEALKHLKQHGIDTLVFAGGDGTMAALQRLEETAADEGAPLNVIGIPKTVDNDLGATDHAPGFGSAARFVASTVRDVSRDLQAMKNFEQVRVLETMGRNAGWLAQASLHAGRWPQDGPQYIGVPERAMHLGDVLAAVERGLQSFGTATVVVSEGAAFQSGEQVERSHVNGRVVLGGISSLVKEKIEQHLGVTARAELLGMQQRSASSLISQQDEREAYDAGRLAAQWAQEGLSGQMVALERRESGTYHVDLVPKALTDVVNAGERKLPEAFIEEPEQYRRWLTPIIGGPLSDYPAPLKRSEGNVIHKN
ncbi:6-phosphofructokinase 1 [Salsuginibacillus halophilus]|uniref:6-phosphofructokinase 1 n=1 Tax=Salsuginibacillus halophilus TaxID=517424 RepID=A0A2P8HKY5_9BACI|nr:diphosphate--fructose-6-phosphate 1-phosphotransferase [Salsuginibacillus halophilus]PSL46888.1 6-phosphofructokinase 1 [Salsuginibacillus halophilus]